MNKTEQTEMSEHRQDLQVKLSPERTNQLEAWSYISKTSRANQTQRNHERRKPMSTPQQPKIGQIMTVHGKQCQIVRIHPFGTVDVSNLITGKSYRVTGLPFISENDK